MLLSWWVWR